MTNIYSVNEKFEKIPFMELQQAIIIDGLIKKHNLKNILELGFYHGKSTAFIAASLAENGGGKLTSIDTKLVEAFTPNATSLIKELGLEHMVNIIYANRSYTWEILQMLEQSPEPRFDFCYCDGEHTWDDVTLSFFLIDKVLKPGGWILFDDYGTAGDDLYGKDGIKKYGFTLEEYETPTVKKACEHLVQSHPSYCNFQMLAPTWFMAQKRKDLTYPEKTQIFPVKLDVFDETDFVSKWSGDKGIRKLIIPDYPGKTGRRAIEVEVNEPSQWNDQIANLYRFFLQDWSNAKSLHMEVFIDPDNLLWLENSAYQQLGFYIDSYADAKYYRSLTIEKNLSPGLNKLEFALDFNLDAEKNPDTKLTPSDLISGIRFILNIDKPRAGKMVLGNISLH